MDLQPMGRDAAEQVALAALGWIAGDPDRAGAFLAASGADPAQLRRLSADPMFLGFVLDFTMQDDASVMAIAELLSLPPRDIARARAGLPGGDLPNWT